MRGNGGWFLMNAFPIARAMEVLFGLVWAIDAALKFQVSFVSQFSSLIAASAAGQPSWLSGWFSFWSAVTMVHPTYFAYSIAILESVLAVSLVVGLARKLAYGGGFVFGLLIWAIPEGFGGPYGPSSTDIGTGIIYAFVFVFLAVASGLGGPNKYTLDYHIEKRFGWWKRIAEI